MDLLTVADYPAIRAAIDVALTKRRLPDAVIALDLYSGAATREVLARDPNAATRTGPARQALQTAAILFCAALLVPAVPRIAGETHGDDTYTRKLDDTATQVAALRARAEAAVAAVLDPLEETPTAGPPRMFRLARGGRGR